MPVLAFTLLRDVVLGGAILLLAVLFSIEARAEEGRRAELATGIATIRTEADRLQGDFKGLLGVRERVEALIAEARALRREAEADRSRLQEQLAEIGRAVVPDAAGAEKRHVEAELAQVESRLRQDGRSLRAAEDLLNRVTEARRALFARRLLAPSPSPLTPAFWDELLDRAVPQIGERLTELGAKATENTWDEEAIGLTAVLLLALIIAWIFRVIGRRLVRRWRRFCGEAGIGPRRAAAIHALIELGVMVAPVPVAIVLLLLLNEDMDLSPGSVDSLAVRCLAAAAGVLLGTGILRAMVAPHDPSVRLLAVGDAAARAIHRTGAAMLLIYAANLVVSEFTVMAQFRAVIGEAVTILTVLACCALLAGALVRLAHTEPSDEGAATTMPAASPVGFLGALGRVDSYRSQRTMAARVTTAA